MAKKKNTRRNLAPIVEGKREFTTIRGKLETVTVRRGDDHPEFYIHSRRTHKRIRCEIPAELFDAARTALSSRVVVYGEASLRPNGEPFHVRVISIRPLIPRRWDELGDIDITHGEDAADYIRRLRDEE